MIKVPLSNIIQKIKKDAQLSEKDIEGRIDAKLDALSGLISREGAAHIIANELGIKIYEDFTGKLQIKNILAGMRDVETVGKVQNIFEVSEFQRKDGTPGKVCSFVLGDETGSIRVVCWNNQADKIKEIKPYDIVKIKSGYVRENNTRKEVHLNERSQIIINPEGETIGEVLTYGGVRKNIADLHQPEDNVELFGTIVQVFDLRFFEVCGICNKRARKREDGFTCDEHGDINPNNSYVLNLILDDGTETIRAVFFKNQAERLLHKKYDEIIRLKDMAEDFEKIKNDLLGNQIKIIGRVAQNNMFNRLEFVTQLVFSDVNPEEELKRLQQELQKKEANEKAEL